MVTLVSALGGVRVRMSVKDCSGDIIDSADFSKVEMTIYRVGDFGNRSIVPNCNNIQVPLSSILTSEQTDIDSGYNYNFEYDIVPQSGICPFPNFARNYRPVFVFYGIDGATRVCDVSGCDVRTE